MPTEITQIDDNENRTTTFRLAGEMFCEDAQLLSRIARDAANASGHGIAIDLADLTLIDSDAASVLKSLSDDDGYEIIGTEILLQTAVDVAERS